MSIDSRKVALDALIDFDKNSSFLNLSIKKYLRKLDNSRDKAFVTNLVYGVVENRKLLDYYISAVSSVKLRKINVVVINILRLGLYQLLFLSTPSSAACNTSVELAKNNGHYKSSGFVNAILRKLSNPDNLKPLPAYRSDDYYRIKYSLSDDVYFALKNAFGRDGIEDYFNGSKLFGNEYYAAVNKKVTSTQVVIHALSEQGISVSETEFDDLIKISSSVDVEENIVFQKGYCHIIGYPSYITAKSVTQSHPQTVIDMCACPGGKTMLMSYDLPDDARVIGFDLYENKISALRERIDKYRINNVKLFAFDGTKYNDEYRSYADAVLCDVPCSCLGMIFKKPDIKLSDIDFDAIKNTQRKILDNASLYVKDGGRLVYSTCTVNPDENELMIKSFLQDNTSFAIDSDFVISNEIKGSCLFMPCDKFGEAFYIAVLKKNC